jgi:hypothetical protein
VSRTPKGGVRHAKLKDVPDALAADQAALDEAIAAAVGDIDVTAPRAARRVWEAFLAFAARPLALDSTFDGDKDNDLLYLRCDFTGGAEAASVTLERRVGTVRDGVDYDGTLLAHCDLTLAANDAWYRVEGHLQIEEYGVTGDGLERFRETVEASEAFAIFTASDVIGLRALAHYQ